MNENVSVSATVGFYGKLPVIDNFVSKRLPSAFINPWDNWLQSAIAASRDLLGDEWLNSYLTSPIWRFLLSAGVCGDKAVAGIVIPSVDRIGRYYPLTVAVVFEQPPAQFPSLFTVGNAWFEQLEDVALTVLEGNLDINAFDELIQTIPVFFPPNNNKSENPRSVENYFYTPIENFGGAADVFVGLNEKLLTRFIPRYSLWCNGGSAHIQAALLACEGLPPISRFAEFLTDKANTIAPIIQSDVIITTPNFTEPEQPSLSTIIASDKPLLTESCWQSWAITHTGKRRKHNEDSLLNRPEVGLWVVADGMGGHKAGDVASQLIVNTLRGLSLTELLADYVKDVALALQIVNTQLRHFAATEYDNQLVGSTVVALVCDSQHCSFLWAGDSRLYRFRDNQLQQLTQDHSGSQQQTPSFWSLKGSNVITRAIGATDHLELDIKMSEVLDGDVFLLSSDGLDKEMSLKEIEHIMQTKAHADIADSLINEVLARGARDNVTVIVVTKERMS